MYKKIVGLSALSLFLVGMLLAGWGPLVLAATWTAPIPPTDLGHPSSMLTWAGFSAVRVLGAVLMGVGLAFSGALNLRSREAQSFALRSLGIIAGVSLFMAFIQAWAVVPRPQAWVLVVLLAVVAIANLLDSALRPSAA